MAVHVLNKDAAFRRDEAAGVFFLNVAMAWARVASSKLSRAMDFEPRVPLATTRVSRRTKPEVDDGRLEF